MLSFARPGCLFFCRSGHPVVAVDQFLDFVGHLFTSEACFWSFLGLRSVIGRRLRELQSLLLVDQIVGLGMRLRLSFTSLVLPFGHSVGAGRVHWSSATRIV